MDKICIHNLQLSRIYSIIEFSRVRKNGKKRRVNFILNRKIKYCTKEILKYFNITLIAFGFIIAIILIKYKPIYEVSISGQEIGYIENKQAMEESIKNNIENYQDNNVDQVSLQVEPEYQLKLVNRTQDTNEEEVKIAVQKELNITYKYYEIVFNNETIDTVNNKEEAEQIINDIKKEKTDAALEIKEIKTENPEEITVETIEVAKSKVAEKVLGKNIDTTETLANVNGIEIAVLPIKGTISSRYGVSSRIRSSNHTGLDIAAPSGTSIKVVADGTVIAASYSGSYGNLVKVSHGNGVETWYAHTSKMFVTVGQKVVAGEAIAAVGSTGNSTGPHLHLEIRINGQHINPQKYLYN